jgi:hypothetical protein
MGLLDDLVNSAKGGIADYLDVDNPISRISGDISKTFSTLLTPGGLSTELQKAANSGVQSLAQTAKQDGAKIQKDGSFLMPNDSTATKTWMGLGATGVAIAAIALVLILRK